MDAFLSNFFGSEADRIRWTQNVLRIFQQISPEVQNHLKLVYLTLCCFLAAYAYGAYLHVIWNINGFLTTLGLVGSLFLLYSYPPYQKQKKFALLLVSSFLQGASIVPLIKLLYDFDTSIFITLFVGVATAVVCFLAAAMVARRSEYIFLGGLLSYCFFMLIWVEFASLISGGFTFIFKLKVYFWLLFFVGLIVKESQEIIENVNRGDVDYMIPSFFIVFLFSGFMFLMFRWKLNLFIPE